MVTIARTPPAVSENQDPRAREYFEQFVYNALKLVGSRTFDLPSIAAGAKTTFTVSVPGARPDKGQSVQVGLPSGANLDLLFWGVVTANDTVTVVVRNPTGGAIDEPSRTYNVRVMP